MNNMADTAASKGPTLRAIPSVDQLLRTEAVAQLRSAVGMPRLTTIAREVTEEMREADSVGGFTRTAQRTRC